MKKILTNRKLENMRKAIDKWANKWNFRSDMYSVYMLGRKYENGYPIYNVDPWDYCEGYTVDFIFGMGIDGEVYDCLHMNDNFYEDAYKEFVGILEKYGLEMDFVDSTHITTSLIDEDMEVEFGYGKSTPIDASARWAPYEIHDIIQEWWRMTREEGDHGTCVIGAYLSFLYNGKKYVAHSPSFCQGSLGWEVPLPVIEAKLAKVGATNIQYHSGYMD